jgi:hypothetical protein
MSNPLVTSDDLGVYLNDPDIDEDRATAMIADAQALCESVVATLPPAASVVVKRVAGRAYVSTTSAVRQAQIVAGGSPFGGGPSAGGVFLTRQDRADLRRMTGGGGAFSINLLPSTYSADLPYYDVDGVQA